VNRELDGIEERAIFQDFAPYRRRHTGLMEAGSRMTTPLDQMLVSLCRPDRLIDIARRFVLFDGPAKKIARHQQVFTVKDLIRRVEVRDANGRREGGVVWHTQGSGKSLTRVVLAKALWLAIPPARIVLCTYRTAPYKMYT